MPDLFALPDGAEPKPSSGDAFVDSRPLRAQYAGREDALDKVKILMTLPGTFFATTEMVATYYEVPIKTIDGVIERNREELEANGYQVLSGSDLQTFAAPVGGVANLGLSSKTRSLAIFTKRAVLNVGMLLRDSLVAQQVRTALLDEVSARPEDLIEDPWDELERENTRARRAIEMGKELRAKLQEARVESQRQREIAERERDLNARLQDTVDEAGRVIRSANETIAYLTEARLRDHEAVEAYNTYMQARGSEYVRTVAVNINARHQKRDPLLVSLGFPCPKAAIVGGAKLIKILQHEHVLKSGTGERNVPFAQYAHHFKVKRGSYEKPNYSTGGMDVHASATYKMRPSGEVLCRRILERLGYELPPA